MHNASYSMCGIVGMKILFKKNHIFAYKKFISIFLFVFLLFSSSIHNHFLFPDNHNEHLVLEIVEIEDDTHIGEICPACSFDNNKINVFYRVVACLNHTESAVTFAILSDLVFNSFKNSRTSPRSPPTV